MDAFLEQVFLRETQCQARYAMATYQRMSTLIAADVGAEEFFREAQALLNQTGAISRVLWPPKIQDAENDARAQARGQHLRTVLGIKEPHAVQDRSLRNHLEHLDERLDDWAERSKNRVIADLLIGPLDMIGGNVFKPEDIFRHYDPSRRVLIFRGESFCIQHLVEGVAQIADAVQKRLAALKFSKGSV